MSPTIQYVHIVTWGCQMNEYDSQRLLDLLVSRFAAQSTDDPAQADLLILNTCSIREKAQEKLFHQLGRWRALKRPGKSPIIAVGGCVATQEGKAIFQRAPYVDLIFGPQTLHRLPGMIEGLRSDMGWNERIDLSFAEIEKFDALPKPSISEVVASVTIMEGCDKFCTYCVVPNTRGPEVCRSPDSILEEVHTRLSQGAREILLLGQNVNAWRYRDASGYLVTFAQLLKRIASLSQLLRLRYLTSHPLEITEELIEVYRTEPKVASFLHLPVQSGSDRILDAMNRGHTVLEYRSILRRLRSARPSIVFSSDFIVGFPGEDESDFEATLELAKMVGFDVSYSFLFSARPGTSAAELPDPVDLATKKSWLLRLQETLSESVRKNTQMWLGRSTQVLVEKAIPALPGYVTGRNDANRWITFPAATDSIGQLVDVCVTEMINGNLRGECQGLAHQLKMA